MESTTVETNKTAANEAAEQKNETIGFTVDLCVDKAEAQLDRLLVKAEKLKSILTECETFVEALDKIAAPAVLSTSTPQIVYAIDLGNLQQVVNADAKNFAPWFLQKMSEDLPNLLATKPKDTAPEAPKKSAIIKDNIIVGKA